MKTATKNSNHREKRELNRKELVDIKSENRSLRKQVARLKKALGHALTDVELAATDADWEVTEQEIAAVASAKSCPLCGSAELGTYTTPMKKTLIACRTCKKYKSVA